MGRKKTNDSYGRGILFALVGGGVADVRGRMRLGYGAERGREQGRLGIRQKPAGRRRGRSGAAVGSDTAQNGGGNKGGSASDKTQQAAAGEGSSQQAGSGGGGGQPTNIG